MFENKSKVYRVLQAFNGSGDYSSFQFKPGDRLTDSALIEGKRLYYSSKAEQQRVIRNLIDCEIIKPIKFNPQKKYIQASHLLDWLNKSPEDILKNPELLQNITKEIGKKVSGEKSTVTYLFLACSNIWVANSDKRPHTLVKSNSSAGKSYTCEQVLNFFPKDLVVKRTRISETALTYLKSDDPKWTWDGKILYLEDISEKVLNADVHKVFLSEGNKSTSITIKPGIVKDFTVHGQPIEVTTTAESEPKIELINRYNQISLDETEEQTGTILQYTASKYQTGKSVDYDGQITNALRKLKRVNVLIPYAKKLNGLFPIHNIKVRRDFPRFLELIMCSAALHQYQREKDQKGYVLANGQDYENARFALAKLKLSEHMVNLSPTQEKMLKVCQELSDQSIAKNDLTGQEETKGFQASDAIAKYPNVHERYWYITLSKFASEDYSLLRIELRKTEESKKRVQFYIADKQFETFNLPEFSKIMEE